MTATKDGRPTLPERREAAALAVLLVLVFALRAIRADQPIVENYVGRQVPTAMVARNLERGSGFLRPRLDTLPAPNLFLVEPPIYALAVVTLRRATGGALEPTGRLVSALGMVLAAWGLFGLTRRREGGSVALIAVAAFAVFPLTIRYGRAFQPDALMLGTLIAGLRGWDEHEAGRGWPWLVLGWVGLATGLALKIVSAYLFVPLIVVILRPRTKGKVALALSTLIPALLWYVHAAILLSDGQGSRASADNGAIWLRVLIPSSLFRIETATLIARFLVVRAFTPIGLALAVWGLSRPSGDRRLWLTWGGSALVAMLVLAGKLHHEYYWLALAPVAAVGVGRALASIAEAGHRPCAALLGAALLGLSLVQSAPTFRTPREWASIADAAREVRAHVPPDSTIVAPEALLFLADRRGYRLEFTRIAAVRAAGEWGATLPDDGPLALVAFYHSRGARFFADVTTEGDTPRLALHKAIRGRYNVIVDRPGVLIADLTVSRSKKASDEPQ